jgi:hypothetical protein
MFWFEITAALQKGYNHRRIWFNNLCVTVNKVFIPACSVPAYVLQCFLEPYYP